VVATCLLLTAFGVPVVARRSHPLQAICAEAVAFVAVSRLVSHSPPDTYYALAAVLPFRVLLTCRAAAVWPASLGFLVALQVGVGFRDGVNFELAFVTLAPWWLAAKSACAARR